MELNQSVNIKNVLITLIDRLAAYSTKDEGPGVPKDVQLFDIFSKQIADIIQVKKKKTFLFR